MTWRKREIAEKVNADIGGDEDTPTRPLEVVFMPGCFDNFEGSQEELDEIIALIQSKVADGSILTESQPVDVDDLELLETIATQMNAHNERTLQ